MICTSLEVAPLRNARPGTILLGVGGPELEPLGVDLEREGPHVLIAGGDRTGRSTALLTCAHSIAASGEGRMVVLAARPSPLRRVAGLPGVIRVATTPDEIHEALSSLPLPLGRRTFLLVDDSEALPEEAGPLLHRLLRTGSDAGLHALVAGRSADLARMYEDWVRYLRSLRCGVLLNPHPADGELFDLRLPQPSGSQVPGRGYLVRGRCIDALQIALPPEPGAGQWASRGSPVTMLPRTRPVPGSGERSA
jgi:S-DNA-T family DNA segregation ATPase FtsK/SpoIIIE